MNKSDKVKGLSLSCLALYLRARQTAALELHSGRLLPFSQISGKGGTGKKIARDRLSRVFVWNFRAGEKVLLTIGIDWTLRQMSGF